MGPGNYPGFIPLQFGFRCFRSTADPLLRLEHDISAVFEKDKFVLAIFFDLQKAYDTTWKRRVLRKRLSLDFLWTFTHLHPTFID